MAHPYKGTNAREAGRTRYCAEGGKVVNFPLDLAHVDKMRASFEKAVGSVAQKRGTSPEELKRQFPSAVIKLGPGAARD